MLRLQPWSGASPPTFPHISSLGTLPLAHEMRSGFLSCGRAAQPLQAKTPLRLEASSVPFILEPTSNMAAEHPQTSGAHSPPPPSPAVPKPGTEAWQQSLDQCLQLLKGPADETRFVGLLLVTKLLPQGSDAVVRQVMEALGTRFIDRLFSPLSRPHQGPSVPAAMSADDNQQAQLSCVLGLALLSACCRLPEVASGTYLVSKCHIFLKVVQAKGLAGALGSHSQDVEDITSNAIAVCDALECLTAVAAANVAARQAMLSSGALAACAQLLPEGGEGLPEDISSTAAGNEPAMAAGQLIHMRLLAVQLLSMLLEGSLGHRTDVASAHADELHTVIQRLGHQLGAGSVLAAQPAAPAAAPATITAPASLSPVGQAAPMPAPQSARPLLAPATAREAAKLQLECLHALLLVLPLPEGCGLEQRLQAEVLAHADHAVGGWLASVRRGLGWLLRSRAAAVQKLSALQLSSALIDLAGHAWLLPRCPTHQTPSDAGSVSASAQRPGEFLQLVASAAAVELPLLLHDTLMPSLLVFGGAGRTPAAGPAVPSTSPPIATGTTQGPPSSKTEMDASGLLSLVAGTSIADDLLTSGDANEEAAADELPPLRPPQQAQQAQGPAYGGMQQQLAAAAARHDAWRQEADGTGGGAVLTAGQRALGALPVVLSILEASIEALAADSVLMEGSIDDADEEGLIQAPVMDDGVARQLLDTLSQAVSSILQFFEALGDLSAAEAAAVDSALQLGAVRVVGRFLADVPGSHMAELLPQLPYLLALRGDPTQPDPTSPPGTSHAAATAIAAAGAASGAAFLLPGLLQAALAGGDTGAQLCRGLVTSPVAIAALARHLQALVEGAVAALAARLSAAVQGDATVLLAQQLSFERRAADAALLLLTLLDSATAPAVAPGTPTAATAMAPLPLMQQRQRADTASAMLPAVPAIVTWGRARATAAAPDASEEANDGLQRAALQAHSPAEDLIPGSSTALRRVADAQLAPYVLMCLPTLVAAVLEAFGLAARAGVHLPAAVAGVGVGLPSGMDLPLCGVDVAGACELVLWALYVGMCMRLHSSGRQEVAIAHSRPGGPLLDPEPSRAGQSGRMAKDHGRHMEVDDDAVEDLLAEFSGSDAESCCDRLAAAVASLLECYSPALAAAQSAAWLARLVAVARTATGGAGGRTELEVLGLNMQMLVSILRAHL